MLKFEKIIAWSIVLDISRRTIEGQCWNCSEQTTFVDLNFGAYLCSYECYETKWKEYEVATRRGF